MKGLDRTILKRLLEAPEGQGSHLLSRLAQGNGGLLTTQREIQTALEQCEAPGQGAKRLGEWIGQGRIEVAADNHFQDSLLSLAKKNGTTHFGEDTGLALFKSAGVSIVYSLSPSDGEAPEIRVENPFTDDAPPAYSSYARQQMTEADIQAVRRTLESDYLTCGPTVAAFEKGVCEVSGVRYGVAVSNGTAALHCAMHALGVGPGDEVIVPPLTFSASANCALYQGATPVFADIDPATLTLDPEAAARAITPRTKAVVAVDYAGLPCDYERLGELTKSRGLGLVADACHSLGGRYRDCPVGSLADITVYSFHPVKHITCGEGGMLVTDDEALAARARSFRSHGITKDFHYRHRAHCHSYDIREIGCNYRISDIQCALGLSQLDRLGQILEKRRSLAARYCELLSPIPGITLPENPAEAEHAYHLLVVLVDEEKYGMSRDALFATLSERGIGVNVHYPLVHLLTAYRRDFGTGPGMFPAAEGAAERLLTLPLHPGMEEGDVEHVAGCLADLCRNGLQKTKQ